MPAISIYNYAAVLECPQCKRCVFIQLSIILLKYEGKNETDVWPYNSKTNPRAKSDVGRLAKIGHPIFWIKEMFKFIIYAQIGKV